MLGALRKHPVACLIALLPVLCAAGTCLAQPVTVPSVEISLKAVEKPEEMAQALQVLALLTVLSLAPAILVLLTSFVRIVVVLSFTRSALATQQVPPNQVLIGLALVLTVFVMAPTWSDIDSHAIGPYLAGNIKLNEALKYSEGSVRQFMLRQTREKDLALFADLTGVDVRAGDEAPMKAVIPAFVISELKTAFQMGFVVFLPFIVIDMVVASTLMSMGMLMLPPMMVSLPFKILMFVLADGWHLVTRSLVSSFR
ncbi:MAG: flagellar type III secretion system pore protein FliP [Bacillota bacterium]|nr:flagellar type III secretion system pore protein FliP [Bacillota bacterium]